MLLQARNVVPADEMLIGGGVCAKRRIARKVAAHLEGTWRGVADGAEERLVGVVPTVNPFCLPVVFCVVVEQVVPNNVQVEVNLRNAQFDVGTALMEVEHRLTLTACHSETAEGEAKTLKAFAGMSACSQQAIG